jgi:hypothetical protein
MAKVPSRRLVIDADVASAAGGEHAVHPRSVHCRDFLEAVLANDHRLVITPEISDEWTRRQSNFSRSWRRRMYARKSVFALNLDTSRSVVTRLRRVKCTKRQHDAMLNDVHLIDAALATDRTVNSLDAEARNVYARACGSLAELKRIVWVNPDKPGEDPLGWLERGAQADRERMLGWRP